MDGGRLLHQLEDQDAELLEYRHELADLAESLGMQEVLSYMNDTLLDGQGVIETTFDWLPDLNEEDQLAWIPSLSATLSWKQAGRLQVNVVLAGTGDGLWLLINGKEIDSVTARELQEGLANAFEEQLNLADDEE